MITKMKKATLIFYSPLKEQQLSKVRDIGVVHLQNIQGRGDEYNQVLSNYIEVQKAIDVIDKYKSGDNLPLVACDVICGVQKAKYINTTYAQVCELQDKILQLQSKLKELDFWGDFSVDDIKALQEKQLSVALYVLPKKAVKHIPKTLSYYLVARKKDKVGVALVSYNSQENSKFFNKSDMETFLRYAKEEQIPDFSMSDLEKQISSFQTQIDEKELLLKQMAKDYSAFVYLKQQLEKDVEFSKFVSGSTLESEENISVLQGYLPEFKVGGLKRLCKEQGIALIIDDVSADDEDVPVLVKNNRLVSLIKPVFDLVGTIPGYREYDISPFFLLFFILFFAMIFGDGGYGLLLFAASSVGLIVSAILKKKQPLLLWLMFVLSIATVIWGAITGNWFGSQQLMEQTFLKRFVVPALNSFDPLSSNVVKYFCFIIAIVHLTIAHLWNFFRCLTEYPRIRGLAQIGSIMLLYGLFFFVLYLLQLKETIPSISLYLIGVGLTLIILFSQQEGNLFKGFLGGFKNIVVILLNAISMFSDIISYIRLFAVGLASLEIAKAFNSMAMGIANSFSAVGIGISGAVVLLFFGHTLNLILGGLSVIVHGVRLNLLEFSGHLNMEWTGNLYDPFRNEKTIKITD